MSLLQALQDARAEIAAGAQIETIFASVAEDYGLNALLLRRKFVESYGDPLVVATSDARVRAVEASVAAGNAARAEANRDLRAREIVALYEFFAGRKVA